MTTIAFLDLWFTLAVVSFSGLAICGIVAGWIRDARETRRRQRLAAEILRGLREPTWKHTPTPTDKEARG